MEKDFHYYLTYALAKITGLDRPETIAYSSQFVDDNNEGQFSVDGKETFFPDRLRANGGYYYPIMTQSLSPKSFDLYVQKYVYVPFHFLPGDNTVKIKGKTNPLSATPNSDNAKVVLTRALESENPYRIGIAIHSFADTWSHQNFTGLQEDWNAVYPWYNVFKSLVPNIGHAEAGHSPDVISESWMDYRLEKSKIDNKGRAFEAVEQIFGNLQKKSGKGPSWKDVRDDFEKIIKESNYDKRIKKISDLFESSEKMTSGEKRIPDYKKDSWIDEALERSENEVKMKTGFDTTDWYYFHQAAKAQLALVLDLIKGL
jgi:hypothetical protein